MRETCAAFEIEPLHCAFGAKLHGLDLRVSLPETTLAEIRNAFEEFSVLVFPDQRLDAAAQVEFSARFGPLEEAISPRSATGPGIHVSHLSNVDDAGALVPPDERGQLFHAANRLWHTDSSFKARPALASLLYAVEVPSSGGETEFVSTRAAFRALRPDKQAELAAMRAVHDFRRSRNMVASDLLDPELERRLPPVSRPLVRVNPSNGERALYIASHADCIEGMGREESRALLDELLEWCTRPEMVYTHRWAAGDLVMWDNRCTMHRGRPWNAATERRVMARTTVVDTGYDDEPRFGANL